MRLEKMLLEYDCFPILAIYVENGDCEKKSVNKILL